MTPIGTMVHYVLPDGPERVHGQCRPGILVHPLPHDFATLVVFRNGPMDGADHPVVEWIATTEHSPRHEFGTWHLLDECAHERADA